MNNELFDALELIEKEKGIPSDYLVEKIKNAITIAVKKDFGGIENVNVVLDPQERKYAVSIVKTVVREVEDPVNEISLDQARNYSKNAMIGQPVEIRLETKQFGRIAAQTAKHVIRQGIREGEREQLLHQMGDKVGEVVTATVNKVDPTNGNAILQIDKNEVILFKNEQLPTDHLQPGDKVKVYVIDVTASDRRCSLKVSRTHKDLVKRLFEMEVPEIFDGTVEVKSISREAGSRTKIAVSSRDENVDPIGACIGSRGMRVAAIVDELGGEKIDIIRYSDDPATFITKALAPSAVTKVVLNDDDDRIAFVSVPDSQLSLAIGNRGQNAKLAARLTGYKIDISPDSTFAADTYQREQEEKRRAEQALEEEPELDDSLSMEDILEEPELEAAASLEENGTDQDTPEENGAADASLEELLDHETAPQEDAADDTLEE